ncbi:MAG: PD-(D/E)XK nuclease family protein [Culicoidibacterales bacterium]
MRFQYIIGRSGVGKSEYAMQQFVEAAKSTNGKAKYFYLVPDQMSFQTEWQLLQRFPNQVASNVFVYSFKNIVRLLLEAWQQQEHEQVKPMSDLGLQMIVRKVLVEKQSQLQVYQRVVKQPGFTQHVIDCLTEFQNWQVDDAAYQKVLAQTSDEAFQQKMADLAIIQAGVEEQILKQGVWSPAHQLQFATELLSNQSITEAVGLTEATIVIDGFHSFNKREQQFLQQLAQVVKQTTLILTVDRPYLTMQAYEQSQTFAISGKTYWQFRQFTKQFFATEEIEEVWLNPQQWLRSENPQLIQLEKWLADAKSVATPVQHSTKEAAIQVVGAMNRLREVEALAQQIRQLVMNGAKYHEIAVYLSQKEAYSALVQRIFPIYEIAFFIDEKMPMYFHPVLELIVGSLTVIKNNWQYEELFRTVKTGFFVFDHCASELLEHELALFERYCLTRGKFGKKQWQAPEVWEYRSTDTIEQLQKPLSEAEVLQTEKFAAFRAAIVEPLKQLEEQIKAATTIQNYCEAIFRFLIQLTVPEQLAQQIIEAEQAGETLRAKQNQQVWQQLIQVFEELVAIAGDEVSDFSQFLTILESGFEQLKFQVAPPALDHVLIGDFERARFQMAKNSKGMGVNHAFVLGVNEGFVPFLPGQNGVLSQSDREQFAAAQIQLAPDLNDSIASQQLSFYMLATNATTSVTFSYVLADGENGESEMYPARILQQLCQYFQLTPRLYPQMLGEVFEPFALNPNASYRYLHHHLQQALQGQQLAPEWQATYNWLLANHQQSYFIQRSLNYRNLAQPIRRELVDQCFKKQISGTATRIETYNRCPYRFFAQYMLHLQQPNEYEVGYLQIGNLYHHCLEMISQQLFETKRRFADLSESDIQALTTAAVQKIEPYLRYHAFYENARSQYLLNKLINNVIASVQRLVKIDQHSQFDLRFAEVSFGQKQSQYAARTYPIAPDYQLNLRGKIDRIDTLETEVGTYVRIVDYKSTDKSIDFDEIYHGLSLQMPMYLDVAIKDILPNTQAAGMFYFTIQNKKVSINQTEIESQTGEPTQQLLGYALADEHIISKMDDTFVTGKTEFIKGIKKTKAGLGKTSMVLSQQEMMNLTEFTNEKLMMSAEKIVAGDVAIEPKGIEQLPCSYCPYRSLCQFDQQLPENPGCYASKGHRSDVLQRPIEGE